MVWVKAATFGENNMVEHSAIYDKIFHFIFISQHWRQQAIMFLHVSAFLSEPQVKPAQIIHYVKKTSTDEPFDVNSIQHGRHSQ